MVNTENDPQESSKRKRDDESLEVAGEPKDSEEVKQMEQSEYEGKLTRFLQILAPNESLAVLSPGLLHDSEMETFTGSIDNLAISSAPLDLNAIGATRQDSSAFTRSSPLTSFLETMSSAPRKRNIRESMVQLVSCLMENGQAVVHPDKFLRLVQSCGPIGQTGWSWYSVLAVAEAVSQACHSEFSNSLGLGRLVAQLQRMIESPIGAISLADADKSDDSKQGKKQQRKEEREAKQLLSTLLSHVQLSLTQLISKTDISNVELYQELWAASARLWCLRAAESAAVSDWDSYFSCLQSCDDCLLMLEKSLVSGKVSLRFGVVLQYDADTAESQASSGSASGPSLSMLIPERVRSLKSSSSSGGVYTTISRQGNAQASSVAPLRDICLLAKDELTRSSVSVLGDKIAEALKSGPQSSVPGSRSGEDNIRVQMVLQKCLVLILWYRNDSEGKVLADSLDTILLFFDHLMSRTSAAPSSSRKKFRLASSLRRTLLEVYAHLRWTIWSCIRFYRTLMGVYTGRTQSEQRNVTESQQSDHVALATFLIRRSVALVQLGLELSNRNPSRINSSGKRGAFPHEWSKLDRFDPPSDLTLSVLTFILLTYTVLYDLAACGGQNLTFLPPKDSAAQTAVAAEFFHCSHDLILLLQRDSCAHLLVQGLLVDTFEFLFDGALPRDYDIGRENPRSVGRQVLIP